MNSIFSSSTGKRKVEDGLGGREKVRVESTSYPPTEADDESVQLCERCKAWKLDEIFSPMIFNGEVSWSPGSGEINLGHDRDWDVGFCELCSFLETVWFLRETNFSSKFYVSRAQRPQSFEEVLESGQPTLDIVSAVDLSYDMSSESLTLTALRSAYSRARLAKGPVDFSSLRYWLALCDEIHPNACGAKTNSSVPYMKLIDCFTREVLPAGTHPYVTLSYVWGTKDKAAGFSNTLPASLPATIEDAITATKELGFRYLWIDRYCIDQENSDEANAQIRNMGFIYRDSSFTIIAAAGNDPTYGLPGIGQRQRKQTQTAFKIGNFCLIKPKNPQQLLQWTHWATRGWTYQEALLSKRRLVFTEEQVYFECQKLGCLEGFVLREEPNNISNSLRRQTSDIDDYIEPSNQLLWHLRGNGVTEPSEILSRIGEYTRRMLTYNTDRLNAFHGILETYQELHKDIFNIWGSPIRIARTQISSSNDRKDVQSLHMEEFIQGLCWCLSYDIIGPRGLEYPSWSWTGWTGSLDWDATLASADFSSLVGSLSFELPDGKLITWDQLQGDISFETKRIALSSRYIHITAKTTQFRVLEGDEGQHRHQYRFDDGYYLDLRHDFHRKGIMSCDCKPSEDSKLKLLLLASNSMGFPYMLSIKELDEHVERVGGEWFNTWSADLYDPHGNLRPDRHLEPGSAIFDRYGQYDWSDHLVTTMETFRLG